MHKSAPAIWMMQDGIWAQTTQNEKMVKNNSNHKFRSKSQSHQISSIFSHHALNPFDTPNRAKIGAKSVKTEDGFINVQSLPCHYNVRNSLTPKFACYTMGLPSNLSSVPHLPQGCC